MADAGPMRPSMQDPGSDSEGGFDGGAEPSERPEGGGAEMATDADPKPAPPPEPVALEEYYEQLAQALCARDRRCLGEAHLSQKLQGRSCQQAYGLIEDGLLERAVAQGEARYDAQAAGRCVQALRAQECSPSGWPSECNSVYSGHTPVGEPCERSLDCVSNRCALTEGACPATCVARVPEGGVCESLADCDYGLTCDQFRCKPPRELDTVPDGEACDWQNLCGPASLCVENGAVSDAPGTCTPADEVHRRQKGQSCDLDNRCAPGLSCVAQPDGNSRRCQPPAQRDGACRDGFPNPCPYGQVCSVQGSELQEGQCIDRPGAGETCLNLPVYLLDACAPGLYCDQDVCVRPLALNGESCRTDGDCESLVCFEGKCGDRFACGAGE